MTKKILALTALISATAIASPALAQMDSTPKAETAMQQPVATDYSQEKLEAYAESAIKIIQIHQQMAPQINQANADKDKEAILLKMQEEMASAIQSTPGITVEEYQQISLAAQGNEQLSNRIRGHFEQRMQ